FDYASILPRARAMMQDPSSPRVHLVMVPNPPYHPTGDFVLPAQANGLAHLALDGEPRLTYGNIGVYDTALFPELPRRVKIKISPMFHDWISRGVATGERYDGPWANIGTPSDLEALDRELSGPSSATANPR